MSTSKDNWKPEETRYFFQLYAEERRKGNKVGQQMNKVGKNNIMDAFELRFKKGFSDWKRDYKNNFWSPSRSRGCLASRCFIGFHSSDTKCVY
ncbi:hypothetical protein BRARA_E02757 [Brassica rapa]|uniref:Myb/SANT-like domain-containing protein n=1 Tax=Brassica campestris TaxID=3711 RepID=A0A397ZMQ1_BRACM|nr:hypothetical protein BRARA_E02757 [Brassica rapa]